MPDSITRLRDADPVSFLPAAGGPPPSAVLERIVASPPEPPRRRRVPRIAVAAAAGLAVAAIAVVAALAASGGVSLAERAYAATSPGDAVVYSETTVTQTGPGLGSVTRTRMWQHGDRMHNLMDVVQRGKAFRYEHDQRGDVFRTLLDGKVESIRADDPGWRDDEGREGFAQNLRSVVDRFRARIEGARDAGETTFGGRRAHAYVSGDETFYVDPSTALPLGSVLTTTAYEPEIDPATRKPIAGKPNGELRISESVDRFERLPPTPGNLALLDAPAIDAAER